MNNYDDKSDKLMMMLLVWIVFLIIFGLIFVR